MFYASYVRKGIRRRRRTSALTFGLAADVFVVASSKFVLLASVQEGARKYQGAGSVQPLETIYAQGGANRERMRNYIVNLAAERERQFDVMDKEAQRCRATLMAAPPPPKTTGRKK